MRLTKQVTFIFLLLSSFCTLPSPSSAQSDFESTNQSEEVVLLHEFAQEFVELYEDESLNQLQKMIPDDTAATLLEKNNDWAFILFYSDEDGSIITGYVHSKYVIPKEEAETYRLHRERETENDSYDASIEEHEKSNNEPNNAAKEPNSKKTNAATAPEENNLQPNDEKSSQLAQVEQLRGIALKQPTHVYAQMSTNSTILKSYNQGHILLFRPHNSEWHSATVIIDGQRHSGFIHANDVDVITQNQERLNGFAIRHVEVYASPARNASVLKSYQQGHRLIYRTFTSEWYEATVYVDGVAHTGYIHKSDVADTPPKNSSERLKGVAKLSSTHVYSEQSRNSRILKTYNQGHVLIYRSHNEQWHQATVYLNGKPHTGYIHADDVETATNHTQHLRGIANTSPTRVYASATRNASTLKSYQQGHILKYRSFTPNWYEATVYINGQPHTGYIHIFDVETAVSVQTTINGIGAANPTHVYERASTNARSLKSYQQGHELKYRTFSSNWYEATVYLNSTAHTGYIHKNHVENIASNQKRIEGFALKQPTRAYSRASKYAPVLKTYSFGSKLIYRTYTESWYEATVYVDGKAHTAYFHKDDVSVRNGKIVVIDAGHGGHDPGAIGNGLYEKNLTLDIALRTQRLLEEKGFTVIMTRTEDVFVALSERANIANRANADIFVSIHINAGGGTGIETYWNSKGPEAQKSSTLATSIQNELISETGARNRGVKEDADFKVNRETNMASALVELGFIDHSNDAAKLKQNSYREQLARGIVNGIIRYFS